MEQNPTSNTPEQSDSRFRHLQEKAGSHAVLFSDLGHAGQEHPQHSVRDEFRDALPFPFGRRATDKNVSTQDAMEDFEEAQEARMQHDPDHLEFYNDSADEDTSGRPISSGNVTPDIRPFSSGPSV